MATPLYTKRGKRYELWGSAFGWETDLLRAGQWRMTYCYEDGARLYTQSVTPDTASFVAAAELAAKAMEAAILERSKARPNEPSKPYTKRQRELLEKFRADMAEAGAFVPEWWTHATAREIAQAGIDAVRNWKP